MLNNKPFEYQTFQTDDEIEYIVFLLHGYGSNGSDLVTLAPELSMGCKNLLFVSPNGRQEMEYGPWGCFQWFSLQDRSYHTIRKETEEAAKDVENFIKQTSEKYGVSLSKIFMMGFSQGAMMSVHVAYRLNTEIMGVIGLGGRMNMPDLFSEQVKNKPPALLIHGAEDDIVPPAEMQIAATTLSANGVDVRTHLRPKLAHGIDKESVLLANEFLKKCLG